MHQSFFGVLITIMLVYLNGLLLGLSLIMSLGPQNIFLIRQGVMRKHAALSALTCFISDTLLIIISITGLHRVLESHPNLSIWMTWFGAAFLAYYGCKTLMSSLSKASPEVNPGHQVMSRWRIIALALGFSLLNPHAIIDSLVLIGGSSVQYVGHQQAFLLGVVTSSLLWFTVLTVTTYYFSTVLTRGNAWRRVEFFSALLMLYLSVKLIIW